MVNGIVLGYSPVLFRSINFDNNFKSFGIAAFILIKILFDEKNIIIIRKKSFV